MDIIYLILWGKLVYSKRTSSLFLKQTVQPCIRLQHFWFSISFAGHIIQVKDCLAWLTAIVLKSMDYNFKLIMQLSFFHIDARWRAPLNKQDQQWQNGYLISAIRFTKSQIWFVSHDGRSLNPELLQFSQETFCKQLQDHKLPWVAPCPPTEDTF